MKRRWKTSYCQSGRVNNFHPPPTGLHSHRFPQMERGGNSVTLTEVSSVIMKCRQKYRGLVSQWGRQLNHPSKVVFVLKMKINKWVPSPTTEPASSTTLWEFVFVLKWKINKWVTSPTTEPASWTTRWKVVFVLKWKMNKWVISPRWGPAISTTLRKVVFVQQEKII